MASLEPQEQLVDAAVDQYHRIVADGRGRLLFIAGAQGSGRTRTLARIVERLSYEEPPALLIAGTMRADTFLAWPSDLASQRHMVDNLHRVSDQREHAEKLAQLLGLGAPFHPFLGLLSVFVSAATVGTRLQALLQGPLEKLEKTSLPGYMLEVLHEEADRRRGRDLLGPVVLLLDDLHSARDPWLDVFLDRVSLRPVDLYALVIVSLVGPPSAAELGDESPGLTRVAQREVGRSADWRWLRPLTKAEINEWLGPMVGQLSEELATLTEGNAELAEGLWREWQTQGMITRRSADAPWQLSQDAHSRGSRRLDNLVDRRLQELADDDGDLADRLRAALCLGALEGRRFTAPAVAQATEPKRDPDQLIDELDDTVVVTDDRLGGLVREAGWISIQMPAGEPLHLTQYEFVSQFYWRAFQRLVTPEERSLLSRQLAEALIHLYGHQVGLTSRVLSELFSAAGDQELAGRYRSIAQLQASMEGLKLHAAVLLAWPSEGWEQSDFLYAANRFSELGLRLRDQGASASARPLIERALAIREQALGSDHPRTADSHDDLAGLLQDQHELIVARHHCERALAIREQVLGPDHRDTAKSLNNLALLLRLQGDLATARRLVERALAIWEGFEKPAATATATGLDNLASVLQYQGDLATARRHFERALGIRERVLGPDHRDTAQSLHNLALLIHYQGDLANARRHFEGALAIEERVLGPDHPDTATSLYQLALVLAKQGHLATARRLSERSLVILEKVMGPDDPRTATSRRVLDQIRNVLSPVAPPPTDPAPAD